MEACAVDCGRIRKRTRPRARAAAGSRRGASGPSPSGIMVQFASRWSSIVRQHRVESTPRALTLRSVHTVAHVCVPESPAHDFRACELIHMKAHRRRRPQDIDMASSCKNTQEGTRTCTTEVRRAHSDICTQQSLKKHPCTLACVGSRTHFALVINEVFSPCRRSQAKRVGSSRLS